MTETSNNSKTTDVQNEPKIIYIKNELDFENRAKEVKKKYCSENEKIEKILVFIEPQSQLRKFFYTVKNFCTKIGPDTFYRGCRVRNVSEDFDLFVDIMKKCFRIKEFDTKKLHLISQYDEGFNDILVYIIFKNFGLSKSIVSYSEEQHLKCVFTGLLPEYTRFLQQHHGDIKNIDELIEVLKKYNEYENILKVTRI